MILVDSSVWVETLRHPDSPVFRHLEEILESQACTCGVIIQEVLQGLEDPDAIREAHGRMSLLPCLETDPSSYLAAAHLFRRCRRRGVQVHTVDVLIMILAVQHSVPIFTLDADFVRVASSLERGLKLYVPA